MANRLISQEEREHSIAVVFNALANGGNVEQACKADGMASRSTVLEWIRGDETLSVAYSRAREAGADMIADDINVIARDCATPDGIAPDRARVAIHALMWTASKLKPKTYGDRVEHQLSATSDLLDAMRCLGNKGLPGDNARVIEHQPLSDKAEVC